MRWKIIFSYLSAGMVLLSLFGCRATAPAYIHPSVDISYISKVAVMPFANLTRDEFAGQKLREILIAELLLTGVLDVVETGEVSRVLAQEKVEKPSSLNTGQIKKVGKALGVQAILVGTIEEYGEVRSGSLSAPLVTISLRMLDVESGSIVWSVNHSKGGIKTMARLFGVGGDSISKVSMTDFRNVSVSILLNSSKVNSPAII